MIRKFAVLNAVATTFAAAECDIMCAMIYSVDMDKCECVPISWMECHPQYGWGCDQRETDIKMGRNPDENPYRYEEWYEESR